MSAIGSRTLLGVLVGGIGGYALAQIDVLRKKSFGPSAVYVSGFTVAGMAVGGVIGNGFESPVTPQQLSPAPAPPSSASPTPTMPPQPAPNANYMPPGGNLITLVPGNTTQSEGIRIGDSVTIQLPPGASWRLVLGAGPGGQNPIYGNAPISWTYSGPGQIYLTWTAADGAPQQTTMTFYTVSF